VERYVLVLKSATRLAEQALRDLARQMALVAHVDLDLFTDAVSARTLTSIAHHAAADLDRMVFAFRLVPQ
jgi:hypothetical protein